MNSIRKELHTIHHVFILNQKILYKEGMNTQDLTLYPLHTYPLHLCKSPLLLNVKIRDLI